MGHGWTPQRPRATDDYLKFRIQVACCLAQKHYIPWYSLFAGTHHEYFQQWARALYQELAGRGLITTRSSQNNIMVMIYREMASPCAAGIHPQVVWTPPPVKDTGPPLRLDPIK